MAIVRPLYLNSGVPVELSSSDIIVNSGNVPISDTAPTSPINGQVWWDSTTGIPYIYYDDGVTSQWVAFSPSVGGGGSGGGGREVLTADRTYYVATTGSDSNDGLTVGSPFLTIQKAIDTVCSIDCSIYQATIQIADGTYPAGVVLGGYVGQLAPIIQGNAETPANVVISTTGVAAISNESGCGWRVESVKLQTTSTGSGIYSAFGSTIFFANLVFGACALHHVHADYGGVVRILGSYAIVGGALRHLCATFTSSIYGFVVGLTVTITGTPAFSSAYAFVGVLSTVTCNGQTFSGSATGKRYSASQSGIVFVGGAGTTYLPGNVAGTTDTGGQYI